MSIRTKTILSILTVNFLTMMGLFYVAREVLITKFRKLERSQNQQHLARVRASFFDILQQMETKTGDWSMWDEAYQFVQDYNTSFSEANLYPDAAKQIDMNLIAYFDQKGRLPGSHAFAVYHDANDPLQRLPLDPVALFPPNSYYFQAADGVLRRSGLLLSPGGPLFVASHKVMKTSGDGPAMGYLVFAKYLDEKTLMGRQDLVKIPLRGSIIRDGLSEDKELQTIVNRLVGNKRNSLILNRNDDLQNGYFLLRDWKKEPVYIVEVSLDRKLFNQGKETVYNLMFSFLFISLFSGFFVVYLLERIVVRRIYSLKNQVKAIRNAEANKETIAMSGNDEIRDLAAAMNRMLFTLNLQNIEIKTMLSSITQGLCQVNGEGQVKGQTSEHFWKILQVERKPSFNILDEVFARSHLSPDEVSRIRTFLDITVNSELWNFDTNLSLVPSEFTMEIGGIKRVIECDFTPILGGVDDIVTHVLVTFRDVTRLRELQSDHIKDRHTIEGLLSLVKMGKSRFIDVLKSLRSQKDAAWETFEGGVRDQEALAVLRRSIHTMKGNSRIYGFNLLASSLHELEDYLSSHEDMRKHIDKISRCFHVVEEEIQDIEALASTLGYMNDDMLQDDIRIDSRKVHSLIAILQRFDENNEIGGQGLNEALQILYQAVGRDLRSLLDDLDEMCASLARDLRIERPKLLRPSSDLIFDPSLYSTLQSVLTHLFRNSVYHGFVDFNGKYPEIQIESYVGQMWTLRVSDNGKGLNCIKLRSKLVSQGLQGISYKSPLELAEYIFEEGISTASQVNEISGRGSGMGAIRDLIEDIGGRIELVVGDENSAGYAKLAFALHFPRNFLIWG